MDEFWQYNVRHGECGPFEVYGTKDPRNNVGLKDKNGKWHITPDKGFKRFLAYDDGLMVAFKSFPEGYGWLLIDYHGEILCDTPGYNYIEKIGEGFFRVQKGSKENIIRRDGSLVLAEWPHRVGNVHNGYFSIGKTIRKTKTTPTQYLDGIAHVSGIVALPMQFHSVDFAGGSGQFKLRENKDDTPLYFFSGALADPNGSHYPKKENENVMGKFFEEFINWTLPGLQFFYRDTNADIDVERMYPKGKVFRTGFYATVSTRLQKPAQKIRFLIAGAHVALLCSDENGIKNPEGLKISPRAEEWRQGYLHRNSWLKVLDVYRVGDITQILLLQLPESGAKYLGASNTVFNFVNENVANGMTLVDIARKSLDDKMKQSIHPRSTDEELINFMNQPLGFDEKGQEYPIESDNRYVPDIHWADDKLMKKNRDLSWFVHRYAKDRDIIRDFAGYPWQGINATVCEGCMYSNGTNDQPFGCGRLSEKTFRKNYLNGKCDFWKYCLPVDSWYETKQRMEREKKEEHEGKISGDYAVNLIKDFIKDHLEGKIDNILKFDFETLKEDKKYGALKGPSNVDNFAIVKSLMAVIFEDYWPDLNVETLDNYQYQVSNLIQYQRLCGMRLTDRYFKALTDLPGREDLIDISEDLHFYRHSLGDFIVWPNKMSFSGLMNDYKMRGYIDRLIDAIYKSAIDSSKKNKDMEAVWYQNRKMLKNYQGKEGFMKLMKNQILDEFLDFNGEPVMAFEGISNNSKDYDFRKLPDALTTYHDVMVPLVKERGKKMLEILKRKLSLDRNE